jgi:hypothetical protein
MPVHNMQYNEGHGMKETLKISYCKKVRESTKEWKKIIAVDTEENSKKKSQKSPTSDDSNALTASTCWQRWELG